MKSIWKYLSRTLLLPAIALIGACSGLQPTSPWQPVYGAPNQSTSHPPDTWQANQQQAYSATTLGPARDGIRDFLTNPDNYVDGVIGSLEDGVHLNAMESAKYELLRLHYLLDETADGDAIFSGLDPLDFLP